MYEVLTIILKQNEKLVLLTSAIGRTIVHTIHQLKILNDSGVLAHIYRSTWRKKQKIKIIISPCNPNNIRYTYFQIFTFIPCSPFTHFHLPPLFLTYIDLIPSVHPSESVTIAAFWRKPAGQKGECLFNEC